MKVKTLKVYRLVVLFLAFIPVLLVTGCLDQQGVNVEQACNEAEGCKQAIVDGAASICEQNKFADRYNELDGNGTPSNPYILCTPEQFVDLANQSGALNKSFRLAKDIDLTKYNADIGVDFQIGSCGQTNCNNFGPGHYQYTGTFDGAGHQIINFKHRIGASESGSALFASLSTSGVIVNLVLVNPEITGNHSSAALVGRNDGIIQSIIIEGGSVTAAVDNAEFIGGLVGINKGIIKKVELRNDLVDNRNVEIIGRPTKYTGGAVGMNDENAFMGEVVNLSNVFHDDSGYVGGLVGINKGTISKSKNLGRVDCNGGFAGGLVGVMGHDAQISESYNSATVECRFGDDNVGGLVGEITFPTYGNIATSENESRAVVINSFNSGVVNAPGGEGVGGLVGFNRGQIETCYNSGDVLGDVSVGGLTGINDYVVSQSFVHGATISGTVKGVVYGGSSAVDPLNPTAIELGNGISPEPVWASGTKNLTTVESPFNTYSGVVCGGCITNGSLAGNGVNDYSNLYFRLFNESYVTTCPNPLPANSSCSPQNAFIIHWDFTGVWSKETGAVPELSF